jgi:hypothetical protein
MDTIGLDLDKRESQLCGLTEAGEVIERRIVTSREVELSRLGRRRRPCRDGLRVRVFRVGRALAPSAGTEEEHEQSSSGACEH